MKVEKELSEMSLNELWELFPIFLVEHNDKWDAFYSEMEAKLQYILPKHSIKGRVPKSGVSKHFSHLKEVRLFPKI